jgi:hypothetical protein
MILLTHNVDLDGLGSVILSKFAHIEYDKILMSSYEENDYELLAPHGDKEQTLIATDYRVSQELFSFFSKDFKDFLAFDHHEETLQFKDDERVFVDITKCGTRLFYENFVVDEIKNKTSDYLVTLIDTYDMWRKESEHWEEANNLNRVLWSTMNYTVPDRDINKYNFFLNLQLEKLRRDEFRWTNYELDKISYAKMKEDQAFEKALSMLKIREDRKGRKFGIWWGRNKISQVCSRLMEEIEDLDYVISINTFQPRGKKDAVNGKVSVRANEKSDFSVRDLVGIEGHKGAGGGEFSVPFLINLWNGYIMQIPYQRSSS